MFFVFQNPPAVKTQLKRRVEPYCKGLEKQEDKVFTTLVLRETAQILSIGHQGAVRVLVDTLLQ